MNLNQILNFCARERLITSNEKNEILSLGVNVWRKEGCPLLHLICDNVDQARGDQCPYLNVAKDLIEQVVGNCNALDEYQQTPLYVAARDGKERLVKMLVRAGANPNQLSRGAQPGITALEISIDNSPYAEALIAYLVRKTSITAYMRTVFQETLNDAIDNSGEHGAINKINVLLDHSLVPRPAFDSPRFDCNEMNRGCWIRVVNNVEEELMILRKRRHLTIDQLSGHRDLFPHQRQETQSFYTPYSPATYVRSGLSINLYNRDSTGLIIIRLQRPVIYWYDGLHGERLTRDFLFADNAHLSNGHSRGEYHNIQEEEIDRCMGRHFAHICDLPGNQCDRHGVLREMNHAERSLPWNEGLIRYQFRDVAHIAVNPESKRSAMKALKLRAGIGPDLTLYSYGVSGGTSEHIRFQDLMNKFNIDRYGNDLDARVHSSRDRGYTHDTPMSHWQAPSASGVRRPRDSDPGFDDRAAAIRSRRGFVA